MSETTTTSVSQPIPEQAPEPIRASRPKFALAVLEAVIAWEKFRGKSLASADADEVVRLVDTVYSSLGDPDVLPTVTLPLEAMEKARPLAIVGTSSITVPVGMRLEDVEFAHIRQSLLAARLHRGNTVRLLGISRPTLVRKIQMMLKKGLLDDVRQGLHAERIL